MADKKYPRHNGHVVIEKYPVQRLFLTSGDATVRLSIDYDRSPSGKADVYMHKKCCRLSGGNGSEEKALYDVILIEDQYTLCYDEVDLENGRINVIELPEKVTPEQIYDAAVATRDRVLKDKNRPYTKDMIFEKYVHEQKYPFDAEAAFK